MTRGEHLTFLVPSCTVLKSGQDFKNSLSRISVSLKPPAKSEFLLVRLKFISGGLPTLWGQQKGSGDCKNVDADHATRFASTCVNHFVSPQRVWGQEDIVRVWGQEDIVRTAGC